MRHDTIEAFQTDHARIRINISEDTILRIHNDMIHFFNEKMKMSSFMNLVFYNYFLDSEANLNRVIKNYETELKKLLQNKYPGAIKTLIDDYRKKKKEEIRNCKKGQSVSILLQQKNLRILQGIDEDSENFKCYGKRSILLNYFFTMYAELPNTERFRICRQDTLNIIKNCISQKRGLYINQSSPDSLFFPVQPEIHSACYVIDPATSYAYMLGFKSQESSFLEHRRINIISSLIPADSFFEPTKKQEAELDKYSSKGDAIFLNEALLNIDVLFTDTGLLYLEKIRWLRPQFSVDSINDHIYHFYCTKRNALYYFQRFGKEAIVISPTNIRDEISHFYQDAFSAYKP